MSQLKLQLNNLYYLLSTQESRKQLSEATNILLNIINKWIDPNSNVIPKADSLVKMAEYFGCIVDNLLDLSDIR